MATRSKYTHEVTEFNGTKCIIITDLNQGGMSVTNDIENVVAAISKLEGLDPADHLIVYQDSEGTWDGWNHTNNSFIPLGKKNAYHAINSYKKKIKEATNFQTNKTKEAIMNKNPDELKRSFDPGPGGEDTEETTEETSGDGAAEVVEGD